MITNSFPDERCKSISESLKVIREDIASAAARSGRDYSDISLMAVTKTVPVEYINYSLDCCGVTLIGENKVQEFLLKSPELHLDCVQKHIIGHLQSNKVKKIVPLVDMIQSVDSVHIATEISKRSAEQGITSDILLELNIGDEASKTGFDKTELFESLHQISELGNLSIKGIMTIPPICDDKKTLCGYFDSMSQVFSEIKAANLPCFDMQVLSMGMSGDYREAIEHGSNMVRIGSLIYGARIYK